MMKKQQQDYQRSRDPFQYGQQVAQRRYSEIISGLQNQSQATQQSYGDLYSQARQQAVRGQAAGGPTLSGGMGQQQRDFVSAIEMQQLGQIGNQRNIAMRDLYSQGQAAFSNAQLEGQQVTQMELQNQQTQLQLVQQRQSIELDPNLTDEQKQAQLAVLEGTQAPEFSPERAPLTFGQSLTTAASFGVPAGIATASLAKLGGSSLGIAKMIAKQGVTVSGVAMKAKAGEAGAKFVATASKTFAGKTGLAALWQGTKMALLKSGLAKGSLAIAGKGAAAKGAVLLTGLGPVGWGILAVGLTATAIWGISQLNRED
jgi:hypothetical protein